jgi:hypothetical protein
VKNLPQRHGGHRDSQREKDKNPFAGAPANGFLCALGVLCGENFLVFK